MSSHDEDDDDIPQLSAAALAALQSFREEEAALQTQFDSLKNDSEARFAAGMTPFKEDWQLSQFWYDTATGNALAEEILRATSPGDKIALISAPTAFSHLRQISKEVNALLLEFDRRFEVYAPDFCFYDYNKPLHLERHKEDDRLRRGACSLVLLDPPFLSEECFEKTALTVNYLLRDGGKIIVCTGFVMQDTVKKLLNVRTTKFRPIHHNNLANEFRCYANYETSFGWDESNSS